MILSDAHMLPIYTRAKLAYDYKTMQLALIIELASCCNSPEKPIIQTKHLIITIFIEIIEHPSYKNKDHTCNNNEKML